MTLLSRAERTGVFRKIWICAASGGVPSRSLYVAIVVGTILNIINQGDALVSGKPLDWLKIILTYAVPYCVCTYGAVSFQLQHSHRIKAVKARTGPRGYSVRKHDQVAERTDTWPS